MQVSLEEFREPLAATMMRIGLVLKRVADFKVCLEPGLYPRFVHKGLDPD